MHHTMCQVKDILKIILVFKSCFYWTVVDLCLAVGSCWEVRQLVTNLVISGELDLELPVEVNLDIL